MPFTVPWTDGEPDEVGRATYQHLLSTIAGWAAQDWHLSLAVLHEGEVVGRQDVMGREFGVRREVVTGSWLGLAHQGRGIGTEMRAAALHLAFEGSAPGTRSPKPGRTTAARSASRGGSGTSPTASRSR